MLLDTPIGDKDQLLRERYHTFVVTNRIPEALRRQLTKSQLQHIQETYQSSRDSSSEAAPINNRPTTHDATFLRKRSKGYSKLSPRVITQPPGNGEPSVRLIDFTQALHIPEQTSYYTVRAKHRADGDYRSEDVSKVSQVQDNLSESTDIESLVITSKDYKEKNPHSTSKADKKRVYRRPPAVVYKLPPVQKSSSWLSGEETLAKITVDSAKCKLVRPITRYPTNLHTLQRHLSTPSPPTARLDGGNLTTKDNNNGELPLQTKSSDCSTNLSKRRYSVQDGSALTGETHKLPSVTKELLPKRAATAAATTADGRQSIGSKLTAMKLGRLSTHKDNYLPSCSEAFELQPDTDSEKRKPVLPSSTTLKHMVISSSEEDDMIQHDERTVIDCSEYDSFARRNSKA